MQVLQYHKPTSLDEALRLMDELAPAIRPYAGGTDLMVQLRAHSRRMEGIAHVLDLGGLPLSGIQETESAVVIGPATTHATVAASPVILRCAPMLAQASASVGSPQIRNAGTVGGNIANGSPAADTLSPFVALNAVLTLQSVSGTRDVLVKDIYLGANKVTIAPNELVTAINFPKIDGFSTAFVKLGRRKALAISRMNVAAALKLENGVIAEARIAPGCVFASPDRVECAESMLLGKAPSVELFTACGEAVSDEMVARTGVRWSTAYKKPVIAAMVRRALCRAAGLPEVD